MRTSTWDRRGKSAPSFGWTSVSRGSRPPGSITRGRAIPEILESDKPYPLTELSLPPSHRINVGVSTDGSRYLGNASVSAATAAFWSDVLTPEYHGYSDGYAMVNDTIGVKWSGGAVTTLVKVTNLFNESVQQHIFGDILRRTVTGEARFSY